MPSLLCSKRLARGMFLSSSCCVPYRVSFFFFLFRAYLNQIMYSTHIYSPLFLHAFIYWFFYGSLSWNCQPSFSTFSLEEREKPSFLKWTTRVVGQITLLLKNALDFNVCWSRTSVSLFEEGIVLKFHSYMHWNFWRLRHMIVFVSVWKRIKRNDALMEWKIQQ